MAPYRSRRSAARRRRRRPRGSPRSLDAAAGRVSSRWRRWPQPARTTARGARRDARRRQERPAAKAVSTTGTATLRQQLSRPLSCSPRRDRIAEVIDMPLGRVGHRLGSGRCDESFFRPVGNHDRACGFLTAIERSRNPEGGYARNRNRRPHRARAQPTKNKEKPT